MKKLVLTTLAITGLSLAAFAQGTVSWTGVAGTFIGSTNGGTYSSFSAVNGSTGVGSTGNTLGNNTANDTALGYNGYYYELLVSSSAGSAPTTFSQFSAWSDANLQATNGPGSNGRIIQTGTGGAGNVANNTQATANNWPASTTESVILVGWSANLGTTWATALANAQNQSFLAGLSSYAYWGVSSLGSLASASGNPGVTVFGTGVGQINNAATPAVLQPLGVTAVPEPTTIALAAIGGASLLLFRRKK
jgi:hypothetical protein